MKLKRSREEVTKSVETATTVLPAPSGVPTPICPHGPMILFKRKPLQKDGKREDANVETSGSGSREKAFFACSAYRNRKDCDFYYAVDDKKLKNESAMKKKTQLASDRAPTKYDHNILYKNFLELCLVGPSQRRFCSNCNLFIKRSNEYNTMLDPLGGDHKECEKSGKVTKGISELLMQQEQLKLFVPSQNKSGEAQFYFTSDTQNFFLEMSKSYSAVLGIGVPSIILSLLYAPRSPNQTEKLCLCMDMDWKLGQFLAPKNFAQFNMCNQHFFTEISKRAFERLIAQFSALDEGKQKKLLVLVDPPYGIKPELLRNLFQFIKEKFPKNTECKFALCMPYFLKPNIRKALPDLRMTDFRCNYLEHRVYSGKQNRGSPARLFTNIEPNELKLPETEYKFCGECSKYVHKTNKHCKLCKKCTTVDGLTYHHCHKCRKCVKSVLNHCFGCKKCHSPKSCDVKETNIEINSQDEVLSTKKKMRILKNKKLHLEV